MQRSLQSCYRALGLNAQQTTNKDPIVLWWCFSFGSSCCGDVHGRRAVIWWLKQLKRLLVCLCPSDCIEGLFLVLANLHLSALMCIHSVLDKLCDAFGVVVLWTDSYKQLERLLVCLHPSDCIKGLFSVLVQLHSSAQMCTQRVFEKLCNVLEVVVLLERHRGIKFFRLTVLDKQCLAQ